MNKEQVVGELSKVRGAIPLPAAMTRRGFVAGAGAAVAAAAMAGTALADQAPAGAPEAGAAEVVPTTAGMQFSGNEGKTMGEVLGAGWLGEEPEITDIAQTLTTHIVMCGAGHAGTAVARHAAELGSDVIVVDSQSEEYFMVLGNDVGHLNSSWQMDVNGVPRYDETEFMNEFQIYGAGRANPKYVRDFAYRSGEAFDWFIDGFTDEEKADITCLNWPVVDGYNYRKGIFTSYVGTPNFGGSVGLQEAVLRNQQKAKDAGAQFLYETKAVRLVHNDDDTEVTGVICEAAEGTYIEIDADAVVLACGDIGANTQMYNAICAENYALGEYKDCSAMSGRDGSGIAMAMRIGAKVEIGTGGDMCSRAAFPMSPMEGAETIWLNKYGKRFCNEAYGGPLLSGCAVARQPGDIIYSVWDSDWKTVLLNQIAGHLALKNWARLPSIRSASTWRPRRAPAPTATTRAGSTSSVPTPWRSCSPTWAWRRASPRTPSPRSRLGTPRTTQVSTRSLAAIPRCCGPSRRLPSTASWAPSAWAAARSLPRLACSARVTSRFRARASSPSRASTLAATPAAAVSPWATTAS